MSADDARFETIDDLLRRAREGLARVRPEDLAAVQAAGAYVVDIRPVEQRRRDGELPGAIVVDRNVLEWRLAPSSDHRIVDLDPGTVVVIVCNEGYSSSLAADTLRRLGVTGATDLVGGFQAWVHRFGPEGPHPLKGSGSRAPAARSSNHSPPASAAPSVGGGTTADDMSASIRS